MCSRDIQKLYAFHKFTEQTAYFFIYMLHYLPYRWQVFCMYGTSSFHDDVTFNSYKIGTLKHPQTGIPYKLSPVKF